MADSPSTAAMLDLRRLLAAQAMRKIEGLKLYRPMPFQEEFHKSLAPERIVRGGNRGGKTLCSAVEVARAVTGQDTFDKYPKKDGICYCVGRSGREIAQKIWPALGKPGAFRIIRDVTTREWRAFDPDHPDDKHRFRESRPAPALLPKRMVKSVAWLSKKDNWPRMVVLTNGWQIHFYSSEGKPTQGTDIDLAWIDEEIADPEWYSEIAARLVDRRGKFFWSATPQAGTERLYALHLRAEQEAEVDAQPRSIEEFFCTIETNKHISERDKRLLAEKFKDDESNYAVRIRGEFAILSGRVYSEYSTNTHEIDAKPVPPTWTRFAAVDPGRQVCAVLFGAVPPPEEGDFFDLYDELYLKDCSAAIFGQEMARKCKDQQFQAFLIDMSEGRKHDTGGGQKIYQQYSEQLKLNRVASVLSGHEFFTGNDNVLAGIMAVRHWLRLRTDGTTKIRVHRTLKNFINEIKHYRNQKDPSDKSGNLFLDKPIQKRNHLLDCLRYLVQYGPAWVPPSKSSRPTGVYAWYMKEKDKERKKPGGDSLVLGPGGYGGGQGSW
jgi:hypothetical protein